MAVDGGAFSQPAGRSSPPGSCWHSNYLSAELSLGSATSYQGLGFFLASSADSFSTTRKYVTTAVPTTAIRATFTRSRTAEESVNRYTKWRITKDPAPVPDATRTRFLCDHRPTRCSMLSTILQSPTVGAETGEADPHRPNAKASEVAMGTAVLTSRAVSTLLTLC